MATLSGGNFTSHLASNSPAAGTGGSVHGRSKLQRATGMMLASGAGASGASLGSNNASVSTRLRLATNPKSHPPHLAEGNAAHKDWAGTPTPTTAATAAAPPPTDVLQQVVPHQPLAGADLIASVDEENADIEASGIILPSRPSFANLTRHSSAELLDTARTMASTEAAMTTATTAADSSAQQQQELSTAVFGPSSSLNVSSLDVPCVTCATNVTATTTVAAGSTATIRDACSATSCAVIAEDDLAASPATALAHRQAITTEAAGNALPSVAADSNSGGASADTGAASATHGSALLASYPLLLPASNEVPMYSQTSLSRTSGSQQLLKTDRDAQGASIPPLLAAT